MEYDEYDDEAAKYIEAYKYFYKSRKHLDENIYRQRFALLITSEG